MVEKVKVFIDEVIAEMKKVNWTSRKDLVNAAFVVLASAICLGLFITAVDLFLSKGLKLIVK
ncbi:MAG: preprotein translocase subunit SecE [Candidatus Omnitrophica bacterium]|nr:preprotein translocase subunit SecE [Candidatus Omnitrophota bacterium]